jgi:hypothetical protein
MKEKILHNWTVQRIFYILMGLGVIAGSVTQKEWLGVLLGAYFLAMGVFAFGCAGTNGCYMGNSATARRLHKQQNLPGKQMK